MDEQPGELIDATRLLERQFAGLGDGFGVLLSAWRQAVGPQIAAMTMPTRLRDGELRVRCASAAWTSEILHSSGEILQRLGPILGMRAPHRIAPYTGRVPAAPPSQELEPVVPQLPPLDDVSAAAIHRAVEGIPAGPTRDSMERAMQAAHRARKR